MNPDIFSRCFSHWNPDLIFIDRQNLLSMIFSVLSFFMLSYLTLTVFVAACALSDLLTRKIPNPLIACGLLCAVASRLGVSLHSSGALQGVLRYMSVSGVLRDLADMAAGFLLPYFLLGVLVRLKMLGGGDVKLLSVIGLHVGWRGCMRMMWYSLLAAAGVSILLILRRRNLAERLEYLWRYTGKAVITGKAGEYRSQGSQSGEFAFAVPVLLAWLVYLAEQMY